MAPKSQSATAPYLSSQIGVFESLEAPILNNRGARYEGDIFSVLWQSPYILRSWEFALADGAIDCNQHFELGTSFVDRLWKTKSHFQSGASKLLLFDVKSKVSREAGDQIYNTSARQQNAVAFYIGICAADTSFVELIPNIYQNNGDGTEGPSENRELAVNISRASRLHASAYRLDPCNSPYRMPLALLLEAIHRVRRCVQGKGPYVNPWTLVEFPDWIPSTTSSTESLTPAEDTQHFTAYKAAMEIGRLIRIQSNPAAMELDLVGLQPRLADFKLITIPQTSESQTSHRYQSRSQRRLEGRDLRQSFIQHKLDGKDRSRYSPLSKVAVARGEGKDRRWYFSAFDRFDFLFYQFDFSDRPNLRPYTEFFFLPERELPDLFYETHESEVDFDAFSNFTRFRIHMDNEGRWVQSILKIVLENPEPRQTMPRPLRTAALDLPAAQPPKTKATNANETTSGRGLYADIMTRCHRQFYHNIMRQCAKRMSGLIVVLATDHPMGDFGFLRYKWTQSEQLAYSQSGISPKTVNDLPAYTPIIPIYYYVKDLGCDFRGPNLTAPQYRRLNSCRDHRLIIWNLWGPDEVNRQCPLVAIPSEDLCPTQEQRALFLRNLDMENNSGKFAERTPLISSLLNTGLLAADYTIYSQGPLNYHGDGADWSEVWKFFERFTQQSQLQHPRNCIRNSALYRHTLCKLNTRLVQEYMLTKAI